ncbi:MAG: bifunctional glutamate N-acetyltransferase/amino-acid acetyltransferase ArgJ [Pseudomonadales bacterium]|nr:bifunctional glutamate N-acetyltransferase/amino-acid acetyltransferase ArgJ [Pseudomonadales bacterium]MBO6594267.1 bifunctional glutamate N-acetyltransferase/amino-acid acetyltransferase ArgJ [Pseudomonadales bacterium]MBO6822172.1 bifunctional glutamate N-acetyltransferase/amino-acid acetyltransferase ArgJ [Pseudomonadales bacterium]
MAVGEASTEFEPVPGVKLASVPCGIKGQDQLDLVLFEFEPGSTTAGVFTQSHFAAAPVIISKDHLAKRSARYFLINSGNANAATGEAGKSDALTCCQAVSQQTGSLPDEVLPFSTGVIGEKLQVEHITNALPDLKAELKEDNWLQAAYGIMTTDTRPKICSRQTVINDQSVTITGIAKGAGMIQPNMATMLAYVATDAQLNQTVLQALLENSVNQSFNRITVDSDTSTNDSCMLTATGVSGVDCNDGPAREAFVELLDDLMRELAHAIVRDGEGATKFVAVEVRGGKAKEDCLEVAYAIANSPLMKTALFASDANWGRIVMAIGKANVELDVSKIDVFVGDVCLMRAGGREPAYTEAAGAAVMAHEEITITVDLNLGEAVETVWTSDLSHEYVTINAEYRT